MNNLFIIYETYTNGYETDMLDIISLLAILCGILVIISKNPIVSVLFLIGLFANISCYLIILGLSFIGLSYLIVYIGAVCKHRSQAALVRIQLYKVFNKLTITLRWLSWLFLILANSLFILSFIKNNVYLTLSCGVNTLNNKLRKLVFLNTPLKGCCYLPTSPIAPQKYRLYSTSANENNLNDKEFSEWLSGFVDGEGCFRIKKDFRRTQSPFVFEFLINLHKDDLKTLEYIQTRINVGNISTFNKFSRFSISSKTGIARII